ncbi:MAG: SGNH/GDSL hydrolase family protein [Pseudomonadota bacterium]
MSLRLRWARRSALISAAALAAMLAWLQLPAFAQSATNWRAEPWVGTFGKAPAGPPQDVDTQVLTNQTVRLVAHTSVGGNRVRIRLSNEMGATALQIGAASVALRQGSGYQIVAGSNRVLTFGGVASITIPPGAPALSDPVDLPFAALADLAVSVHLPASTRLTTVHPNALQTVYISTAGNHTGGGSFPLSRSTWWWPFLTEVEVVGKGAAIVAIGDSITDGSRGTNDSNNRWPDWLARRLQSTPDSGSVNATLGVVNRGISGNRLLTSTTLGSLAGRNGLERFERDVLATAGARYLIVALGINDIGYASSSAPMTAATFIGGYRQLIARAHARGIAVIGATLGPFQGSGYYSTAKDTVRQAINNWIRTTNELDGVVDFDRALQDPANPLSLRPAYDSGDRLHPNNFGYQAMGNAIPLDLFRSHLSATAPQEADTALAQ